MNFFSDNVILQSNTAVELYNCIKDLPIIDYHCHLNPSELKQNKKFDDIGELWLGADHYKWRSMRIAGVDEKFITGTETSFRDKFFAFAEIMPKLAGSPVYYWTHFELNQIFGINLPLNSSNAETIYNKCNEMLADMDVHSILKKFKVEFIATTDDPIDSLEYHGQVGDTTVAPTFRPDRAFLLDDNYMQLLSVASGVQIVDTDTLLLALENRLDFFISKGCKITDHGLTTIPAFCDRAQAQEIYGRRHNLSDMDKELFAGFMLTQVAKMCKVRGVAMQWHFGVTRNINTKMFAKVGVDAGFDVFNDPISADKLINILNYLSDNDNLPKVVLYTLNPSVDKMISAIAGAFKDVRIGVAWWFNDTLEGVRSHLVSVMEYNALGVHLGMLTDSRSFTSYVRHDFFRRILADLVGSLVEKGEYPIEDARTLVQDVTRDNIKNYLGI